MNKLFKTIVILLISLLTIPIISSANDELVYIDKSNIDTKYHRITCSHIFPNGYTTISVEKAFNQGYRACPDCSPPKSDVEKTEREKHAKEIIEEATKNNNEHTNSSNYYTDDRIVYVTKNGSKFHKSGCDYLDSTPYKMTVLEASNKGYAPCKVCKPYGLSVSTTENKSNRNIIIPLFFIIIITLIIYIVFNEKRYYKIREYNKKKS